MVNSMYVEFYYEAQREQCVLRLVYEVCGEQCCPGTGRETRQENGN